MNEQAYEEYKEQRAGLWDENPFVPANRLIWLNTKDDIIDCIGDAIISMQEAGNYTDAYILSYLDEYIGHRCDLAFVGFSELEEEYARHDMYVAIHSLFNL